MYQWLSPVRVCARPAAGNATVAATPITAAMTSVLMFFTWTPLVWRDRRRSRTYNKKGGRSRPSLSCDYCLLEAIDYPDSIDVDVAIAARAVATDLGIALPFQTNAQVLVEVIATAD